MTGLTQVPWCWCVTHRDVTSAANSQCHYGATLYRASLSKPCDLRVLGYIDQPAEGGNQ